MWRLLASVTRAVPGRSGADVLCQKISLAWQRGELPGWKRDEEALTKHALPVVLSDRRLLPGASQERRLAQRVS